jgi:diguanylate cyclase (GGDEF)-like protein
MKYQKLLYFLQNVGKDPSALMFEDYLTGLNNRRFLLHYLKHNIDWSVLEQQPVSLVMIDIDFFKRINTQYGSTIGDQALAHVAGILKDVSLEKGLPILYAGDEFMLLLPGKNKQAALSLVAELFYQINNNVFFSPDAGAEIPLTVSVGIASAPDDAASGEDLVHQVKNALHHAKEGGRNRYADAGMVSRQAVHYLQTAGIVGRKSQFDQIGLALKKFGEGAGQVVIIDGAPGMGKTSFIDTVHRNLEKTKYNIIRVSGVISESYRPYYLIAYVVMALMNQREDRGVEVLESMTKKEVDALSQIIPQMVAGASQIPDIAQHQREEIFRTFARFFSALAGKLPLVILVDDLHYADPASLQLIRVIIRTNIMRLFVCGTAVEEKQTQPEAVPLSLFRSAYGMELAVQSIMLTPLAVDHVEKFINMTFPGIGMPHNLIQELVGMTQGNPLFMVEMLRKMITDQRIQLKGRDWKMARLEKRYFPKTLEEIIQQKINTLDEESKRFLECASAFGESISLSMLTGSYSEKSSRIHDFLNKGLAHGIVKSQFKENDENIRFSSRSVREIIYGGIRPDQKRHFHEEIGTYHEKLYNEDLLPSAAPLAYHFKHSGNVVKEGLYTRLQADQNQRVFGLGEIPETLEDDIPETDDVEKPAEKAGAEELGDTPLSEAGFAAIPKVLRALIIAVRNISLYPVESKSVTSAMDHLDKMVSRVTDDVERFSIIAEKQEILINSRRLETKDAAAAKIIDLWEHLQLKSLTFRKGFDQNELLGVMEAMSRTNRKAVTPGFWKRFSVDNRLTHILPRQVTYTRLETETDNAIPESNDRTSDFVDKNAYVPDGSARQIAPAELKIIAKIFSAILGAYSKLKLYPGKNPVALEAVNRLHAKLRSYFPMQSALTISRVHKTLLVNGVKVDITGFETVAGSLLKFLNVVRLNSITFASRVTFDELMTFISASVQSSGTNDAGPGFWRDIAVRNRIAGILFDRQVYDISQAKAGGHETGKQEPDEQKANEQDSGKEAFDVQSADIGDSVDEGKSDVAHPETAGQSEIPQPDVTFDDDLDQVPERIRERYLTGDMTGAEAILQKLCDVYRTADDENRKAVMDVVETVLNPSDWRPTAIYLRFALIPLLPLLQAEKNDAYIPRVVALLNQCGVALILFGEYALATWVFAGVEQIQKNIHPMTGLLSPPVVYALSADLKSEDSSRGQDAYQLVSSMGTPVLPMLADLIKKEEKMRPRVLAAELIRNCREPGVEFLKKNLMSESNPIERARILDVIDSVTMDLSVELAEIFADPRDVVRKSAFRLAERLHTPDVIALLIRCAESEDVDLAVNAINSLGKLRAAGAVETLSRLMTKSDETLVLAAVCRAMGNIGDASCLAPLAGILKPRRRLIFKKKYPVSIRAAAAYAVSQIPGQPTLELMRFLANDPDAAVREAARAFLDKQE